MPYDTFRILFRCVDKLPPDLAWTVLERAWGECLDEKANAKDATANEN